jgi:hypothetical protein
MNADIDREWTRIDANEVRLSNTEAHRPRRESFALAKLLISLCTAGMNFVIIRVHSQSISYLRTFCVNLRLRLVLRVHSRF